MQLSILESGPDRLRAGYDCPCGCQPSVLLERDTERVSEGCCCGNEFAVALEGHAGLSSKPGFHLESVKLTAPWGGPLEAAWLVGPSVHADSHDHDHATHGAASSEPEGASAIDPVCGMTVDVDAAREKGLMSWYRGREYFYCGKGCKLEFDEDAERYLDPAYIPSM